MRYKQSRIQTKKKCEDKLKRKRKTVVEKPPLRVSQICAYARSIEARVSQICAYARDRVKYHMRVWLPKLIIRTCFATNRIASGVSG